MRTLTDGIDFRGLGIMGKSRIIRISTKGAHRGIVITIEDSYKISAVGEIPISIFVEADVDVTIRISDRVPTIVEALDDNIVTIAATATMYGISGNIPDNAVRNLNNKKISISRKINRKWLERIYRKVTFSLEAIFFMHYAKRNVILILLNIFPAFVWCTTVV